MSQGYVANGETSIQENLLNLGNSESVACEPDHSSPPFPPTQIGVMETLLWEYAARTMGLLLSWLSV